MNKVRQFYLFTDGACSGNPGPGGWAAICIADELVTELGGQKLQTTNNQMELLGVVEGLNFLLSQKNISLASEVIIYSDSSYVLLGSTQWINGWRYRGWKNKEGNPVSNLELWKSIAEILDIAKEKKVKLQWKYVRGHTGSPGNERCDEISVVFSQGGHLQLAKSLPLSEYSFDVMKLPPEEPIPVAQYLKAPGEKKSAYSYLSKIQSQVVRHKTWAECERRVKGKSGTLFKKAKSADDELEILKAWGLPPSHPIESE